MLLNILLTGFVNLTKTQAETAHPFLPSLTPVALPFYYFFKSI